jgi:TatD DNase family protein
MKKVFPQTPAIGKPTLRNVSGIARNNPLSKGTKGIASSASSSGATSLGTASSVGSSSGAQRVSDTTGKLNETGLFDCHFHVDRIFERHKMNWHTKNPFNFYEKNINASSTYGYKLVGGIHNVVNPYQFDDSQFLDMINSESKLFFTIGVHPKMIDRLTPDRERIMLKLSQHKRCLGIGEFGLEKNQHKLEDQISVCKKLLALAKKVNKPIVLHLRHDDDDQIYEQISNLILESLGNEWFIHFHMAGYLPMYWMKQFLEIFPNSFFGLNPDTFSSEIFEVLTLERTLLETDSPYMFGRKKVSEISYPHYVAKVAKQCADYTNKSLDQVLEVAFKNANHFYKFEVPKRDTFTIVCNDCSDWIFDEHIARSHFSKFGIISSFSFDTEQNLIQVSYLTEDAALIASKLGKEVIPGSCDINDITVLDHEKDGWHLATNKKNYHFRGSDFPELKK